MKRWAVAGSLVAATARGENAPTRPQANAGLAVGLARVTGEGSAPATPVSLGIRGDVLFGRNGPHAWGVGPALGIGTYRFRDLELQAGASVLVPIHEYLPLVFSAGPYTRRAGTWDPGAYASVFWGSRSFNYDGDYGLAVGIVVEGRAGFGDVRERTLLVAAHLDLQVLVLPVLMAINAFR